MISIQLLNAVGLTRTHNTHKDTLLYHLALENPDNRKKVDSVLNEMFYPFYRFFSNYGTGIGETIEEVVATKFNDIIPKKDGKKKSKIYEEYNTLNNKKASNYDFLVSVNGVIKSGEVKVIRAAESKPNQGNKIYEIPSLLEERALSFAEGVGGNGSFQQTKAEMFDYMLGVVMYSDQVDFYIVPSADIKSGKLKVTNQHAGAIKEDGSTAEGHLAVKYLDSYKVLSVYNEEELLAKDMLNKYIV
jgi:hypothetical protein